MLTRKTASPITSAWGHANGDDPIFEDIRTVSAEPHAASAQDGAHRCAVQTQSHRELRAKAQWENQAYGVFLPRRLKTVRHARKLTKVAAPLFPRYLFIRLDLTRHLWRSVNGNLRRYPAGHAWGHAAAASARRRGNHDRSVDVTGFLCFGEDLKIGSKGGLLAGPFAEQLRILDRLDGSNRVRVLLDIRGATVPVQLERKIVTAA